MLKSEYFLFEIDKMAFYIEENDFFGGVINKISVENIKYQRDGQGMLKSRHVDEKLPIPLVSIQNIIFLAGNYAGGHIDGIGLLYEKFGTCYKFFVRNISYEIADEQHFREVFPKRKRGKSLISQLKRTQTDHALTSLHIPDLGIENYNKLRQSFLRRRNSFGIIVTIRVIPEATQSLEVKVTLEKFKFIISSEDVFKLFQTFSVINSHYAEERRFTNMKLEMKFFKTDQYERIMEIIKFNEQLLENERKNSCQANWSRSSDGFEDSKDDDVSAQPRSARKPLIEKFVINVEGIGLYFSKNDQVKHFLQFLLF